MKVPANADASLVILQERFFLFTPFGVRWEACHSV